MKFNIRSFTQLSIVLLAVTIMSVSVLGNSAYSDHVSGSGGTIDVVAAEGSNTISISGTTDRSDEVIVKVLAPNRNIVSIDQITPTGEGMRLGYSTTINTSGPTWNQDGDYIITIQQSGGNCTLVGGTSSDDREHDRDAKWSCSAGTVQGFAQFMEGKYNHIVQVGVTSGTTSETSISIDYLIEHDEYYVSSQNIPTAKDMKKLTLTADGIQGSTTINVSGTTDKSNEVIIKVTAPNGNIVAIAQITPTGGSFATTIETSGALWWQDGDYIVITPDKWYQDGDSWVADLSLLGKEDSSLLTQEALDSIHVNPNPYIVSSVFNEDIYGNRLIFNKLPKQCTISIYTITGELVEVIDHGDENNLDGVHEWDLKNKNGKL